MSYSRPKWRSVILCTDLSHVSLRTHCTMYAQGELAERVKRLVEQLQNCVDPFDLDVFSPYIQSNLHRQLQRSSVSHTYVHTYQRSIWGEH